MARRREKERPAALMERGTISVLYRPRVHAPDAIQRLLVVLAPDDSLRRRVIVIGRNRLPRHARFWGFVDAVADASDLPAILGNARPAGDGAYRITWHGGHAHLVFALAIVDHDEALEESGDYVVTVANPDPAAWELTESPEVQFELFEPEELHVDVMTTFPQTLQERFHDRRYAQLDTVEFLDHPGAELIFIAVSECGGKAPA
ncbi:MAG TPA: hypothetical protein VMU84_14190, partial [Thermoanaerobaculia bacterium]|nr:hypothetical protein [Thermoanaerobaculia bacterium]